MQPHTTYLLLFIAFAWAVFWAVGNYAWGHFNSDRTRSRFPERNAYDWTELRDLAVAKPHLAAFYVWPVLFPLDLIVMLLLAGSMGLASAIWLGAAGGNPRWAWVLPAFYLVADLIEDGMLAGLLRKPVSITEHTVIRLQGITRLKFAGIILTIVQTVVLFVVYFIRA